MVDLIRNGASTQARVYSEGNDLVGIASEFQLPDIEFGRVELKSLGAIAVFQPPSRPLQSLDGSLKFLFPEPTLMQDIHNPTVAKTYQLHKAVDVWGPDGLAADQSYTLVTTVRLLFFKNGLGNTQLGENEDVSAEFTCTRLRQTIHATGKELLAIDVMAGTHTVGGQPVWPT